MGYLSENDYEKYRKKYSLPIGTKEETPKPPAPAKPEYVVRQVVDYSKFTLEELEATYQSADYTQRNSILFALKQKGVDIRDYQRRHEGAGR